jgi:glutamate/tyrosine decarboxylase-like PLP-dependent enzyme
LPEEGSQLEAVLDEFRRHVLPFPLGNIHPRFWGWVVGSGDPVGMLADMLASVMNPNVFDGDQAATLVEAQVVAWSRDLLGLPADFSGTLTSGCAVANLVCLAVARHEKAGISWEGRGMIDAARAPALYCSSETHNSIDKAARLLGLGAECVRRIPALDYRMDPAALLRAVREDADRGFRPFCVVANAGSVNTGAIDPLDEIADICAERGLWLHVDGAFGALACLTEEYRPQLSALRRADSLAFDFHKWMYAPYGVACALTRHPAVHEEAFRAPGAYLARSDRGLLSGRTGFGSLGIELGREFRALKIWMALKVHGRAKFASLIRRNIDQARFLAKLIEGEPRLELAAPVSLNIVCFRILAERLGGEEEDELNREIMLRLQAAGTFVISSTLLRGRFVLRVAITNHRSRLDDFSALVEALLAEREALLNGGDRAGAAA